MSTSGVTESESGDTPARKGRPAGRWHDVTVHVRVPQEVRDFLRGMGGEYGLSVGEVVRFGIAAWLGDLAGALVSVAKNPKAPPRERMRAAGGIRNRIIPMAMFVGEQEERVGGSWAAGR